MVFNFFSEKPAHSKTLPAISSRSYHCYKKHPLFKSRNVGLRLLCKFLFKRIFKKWKFSLTVFDQLKNIEHLEKDVYCLLFVLYLLIEDNQKVRKVKNKTSKLLARKLNNTNDISAIKIKIDNLIQRSHRIFIRYNKVVHIVIHSCCNENFIENILCYNEVDELFSKYVAFIRNFLLCDCRTREIQEQLHFIQQNFSETFSKTKDDLIISKLNISKRKHLDFSEMEVKNKMVTRNFKNKILKINHIKKRRNRSAPEIKESKNCLEKSNIPNISEDKIKQSRRSSHTNESDVKAAEIQSWGTAKLIEKIRENVACMKFSSVDNLRFRDDPIEDSIGKNNVLFNMQQNHEK